MERKVFYNSTDNIKLCGLLSEVNDNKKIVILCHGLTSHKESKGFNLVVKRLQERNVNTFRFDFRGLGESTGDFINMTPSKELADLKASVDYLVNLGYKEMVLLGTSFGGSIVSLFNYNNHKQIKGIVLWYSVIDYIVFGNANEALSIESKMLANKRGYYEITNSKGKVFKLGKDLYDEVYKLEPYKNIFNLNLPILFVHGKKDEVVPYELSVKVSKMCKNSQLELIENGNHSFLSDKNAMDKAIDVTTGFIEKL